jgi:hypothetical protein
MLGAGSAVAFSQFFVMKSLKSFADKELHTSPQSKHAKASPAHRVPSPRIQAKKRTFLSGLNTAVLHPEFPVAPMSPVIKLAPLHLRHCISFVLIMSNPVVKTIEIKSNTDTENKTIQWPRGKVLFPQCVQAASDSLHR